MVPPHHSPRRPDRLVYLTHPDAVVCKAICESFLDQSFHTSTLPDAAAIASLAATHRPDLVLMPLGGTESEVDETFRALDAIRGLHLSIQAFLLAPDGARAELIASAVKRGAGEVFSQPHSGPEIVAAAQKSLMGVTTEGGGPLGRAIAPPIGFGSLTHREQQVLHFVVEGRTNKAIATELGLSYRTVEVHRRHILGKTGARNTADLVRMALER